MSEIAVKAQTMNAGTANEFVRVFFACECGAELASAPLASLLKDRATPWATDTQCMSCAMKAAKTQALANA